MSRSHDLPAPEPAHGTARWVSRFDRTGLASIAINEVAYTVMVLRDGGRLIGFRLRKDDATTYDVLEGGPNGLRCDCPDATYHPERPGGCKHVAALVTLLLNDTPEAKGGAR